MCVRDFGTKSHLEGCFMPQEPTLEVKKQVRGIGVLIPTDREADKLSARGSRWQYIRIWHGI